MSEPGNFYCKNCFFLHFPNSNSLADKYVLQTDQTISYHRYQQPLYFLSYLKLSLPNSGNQRVFSIHLVHNYVIS